MIHFDQLKNKPALLKCLTGLTVEGFMALLAAFEVAYEANATKREAHRPQCRGHRPLRRDQNRPDQQLYDCAAKIDTRLKAWVASLR